MRPDYKTNLDAFGLDTSNPASLAEAAQAWKNAAEARKLEHDIGSASRRSAFVRFWIPIIAQALGMIALVATLLLQQCQYRETHAEFAINEQHSREAAEDATWRDVLSRASKESGPESVFGVFQMMTFLPSPRYGKLARHVIVNSVGFMLDPDAQLVVLNECDFSKEDLITISSRIYVAWTDIANRFDQQYNAFQDDVSAKAEQEKRRDKSGQLPKGERVIVPRQPDPQGVNAVEKSWQEISDALVAKATDLDFGHADLFRCDLSKKDLSLMKLRDGALVLCDVSGSHLRGAALGNVNWSQTAWWLVADLDRKLLDELKSQYAFVEGFRYLPEGQTQATYDDNVKRLEASTK